MTQISLKGFVFSIICILAFASCKSQKGNLNTPKKSGVKFTNSSTLTGVLDKAKAENKLVFVDFYTSWCLPCKLMDEDVFPDKRLGQFMNDNFINYKVNAEKANGVNLAALYQINAYPTLLFLDHKGNVLEKKIGAAYHRELQELAESAMAMVQ